MPQNHRIQQLLDQLFEGQTTPEEVCQSCPECLPEVIKIWRRMCIVTAQLETLFPSVSGSKGESEQDAL